MTAGIVWHLCIICLLSSSSLNICAIDGRNSRNVALTVCKMHALECLGRTYTLTTDDNCNFPKTDKSCGSCHLWETCSGENFLIFSLCTEAKTASYQGRIKKKKYNRTQEKISPKVRKRYTFDIHYWNSCTHCGISPLLLWQLKNFRFTLTFFCVTAVTSKEIASELITLVGT